MPQTSPLELDHATMQRLGRRVADLVAAHLATLRDRPIRRTLPTEQLATLLASPAPKQGRDFEQLLGYLENQVFPYHQSEPHPGYLAFVQGCPTFPAVMGDWLATGFNFFAGAWAVSPGPNALELLVLEWFRQWLGCPAETGGLLTSGGSAATLTAVIAARHAVVQDDPSRIARLVLYTSEQAHSSVIRAGWIAGVARKQVRLLPVDDQWRLKPDALATAVAEDRRAGLLPLMVVATAGTTNTGAVDPLPALAAYCRDERLWLHADAAYGGFTALASRGKQSLAGIELADSVTLDPHKFLAVPFECGCLLVREVRRLEEAFRIYPEYLKDHEPKAGEVNFADRSEQLTRYARALKVWLGVSYYGTEALGAAITEAIARAEYAEEIVRKSPDLEVMAPARLGILCFRAHPRGWESGEPLDDLNRRVMARVNDGGQYLISSTRLKGAFSLRICTPGFRTTRADIEAVLGQVVAAAQRET
jgi:glutamate/tyrosine decarboxylase-like PLP-dependent enzyme